VPAGQIFDVAGELGEGDRLVLQIHGVNLEGDEIQKTVAVQLASGPGDGRKRLRDAGLTVVALGDSVQIANVAFGSRARKSGFEAGWDVASVKVPTDRPAIYWVYLPALLLAGAIWWSQGRRSVARGRGA